jgi:hypothetical protein
MRNTGRSVRDMPRWNLSEDGGSSTGGRNIAAGRCVKPKELSRGDCGSWRKLAAACRKVSHCARVAWRKGCIAKKNQTRNNVARWAQRGQTFGRRRWVDPEGSTGVRRLHLKIERTADGRIFGKTYRLETAKRIAGSSVGLQKMRDWTLWRGRQPQKRKKRLHTE